VARIAFVRRALRGLDVAEHAPDALLLRAPRQHGEGARVGHRDHVGLLDRVEARDRRTVEAHPVREGVSELVAPDREGLQLPEDVGEPQPDEADVPLLDERQHVGGGARGLRGGGGHAGPAYPAVARPFGRAGPPPYGQPRGSGVGAP
jgi:hypothetical protein